jgi:hypothetical protein
MPSSIRSTRALFLLFAILFAGGCSSQKLQLGRGDTNALKRIYEGSAWKLQQSAVDIQVHSPNAVEVNLKGEAIQKENEKDGPMWVPIALFRELPDYLKGTNVSNQSPIELQSYKITGGLWCVVAIVQPSPILQQSVNDSSSNSPPQMVAVPNSPKIEPVHLQVLFVSSNFTTGLPLLIPVSQQRQSVDLAVTLPPNAKFTSLNIESGQSPNTITSLTMLPPSTVGGANRAAAKLNSESEGAWDFTNVTYAGASLWASSLPKILLAIAALCLGAAGVYWLNTPYGWHRKEIYDLSHRMKKEVAKLFSDMSKAGTLSPSDSITFNLVHEDVSRHMLVKLQEVQSKKRRIIELFGRIESDLYEPPRRFDRRMMSWDTDTEEMPMMLAGEGREFSELLDECAELVNLFGFDSQLMAQFNLWLQKQRDFVDHIILCSHRITYINELRREIRYKQPARRTLNIRMFITIALVILVLLTVYGLTVYAQEGLQPTSGPEPERVSILGDFDMTILPKEARSNDVGVALGFIALSDKSTPDKKEIGVGTGNNQAEMEVTKVSDRVEVVHQSKKEIRFSVPVSNIPSLSLLGTLRSPDFQVAEITVTDSLQAALNKEGNLVKLEYVVKGAQDTKDYFGSWLHRFPFDYKSLVIPVTLQQSAIVSKIELPMQPDFTGVLSVKGIEGVQFVEKENSYQLDSGNQARRIMVQPTKEVLFEATLRRTWWQRLFLTVGQLILAIIAGISFGYMITLPEHSKLATTIEGLGLIGLVYLIRSNVSSTYKDLPNIFSGQTPTLFDLFFIISLIIFVGLTYLTWKIRRSPNP